jgi:hypothetical protein
VCTRRWFFFYAYLHLICTVVVEGKKWMKKKIFSIVKNASLSKAGLAVSGEQKPVH